MIDDMTLRNLSPATQRSYLHAVTKFSRHFGCPAHRLGLEGGFKWSSQHDLCRLIGETGQAPLRVSSNQASFGAAS